MTNLDFVDYDGRKKFGRRRVERNEIQFCLEREGMLAYGVKGMECNLIWKLQAPINIPGKIMNSQSYIQNVLKPSAIPCIKQLENPFLLQDTGRPYIAAVTSSAFVTLKLPIFPRQL